MLITFHMSVNIIHFLEIIDIELYKENILTYRVPDSILEFRKSHSVGDTRESIRMSKLSHRISFHGIFPVLIKLSGLICAHDYDICKQSHTEEKCRISRCLMPVISDKIRRSTDHSHQKCTDQYPGRSPSDLATFSRCDYIIC